ncbi:MAG TPA: aldose epimerase family protein [Prolixibacteraceae bacterium]|nr:aldose epimerase family protein [Prolixibacteraceae bacterium]
MNKITNFLFVALLVCIALISCNNQPKIFTKTVEGIDAKQFSQVVDGKQVGLYTLTNESGIGIKVTNFGARVVALCVPDNEGNPVDVVLGYDKLNDYINEKSESFYGAVVGRSGNRIANGSFEIDGTVYQLAQNNGPNHLHGGPKGYYDVVWDANQIGENKIIFTYLSVDGEEGYPGNLQITMAYELTDDRGFKIEYTATTDKPTVCNLTHHSFFNLTGEGSETINDHLLTINAKGFTPVDETLIPFGEVAPVHNTPFDFTQATAIGEKVNVVDEQLLVGGGYDHNWALNRDDEGVVLAATVYSPMSGIQMEVLTNQPGLQFYGGNFLDGSTIGKSGIAYQYQSALCLETQHFPDAPNQANFKSTLLLPGENYKHVCIYSFSAIK